MIIGITYGALPARRQDIHESGVTVKGRKKDNGQAHLSFVQPVEERSLEQGRFNKEENEKLRNLL